MDDTKSERASGHKFKKTEGVVNHIKWKEDRVDKCSDRVLSNNGGTVIDKRRNRKSALYAKVDQALIPITRLSRSSYAASHLEQGLVWKRRNQQFQERDRGGYQRAGEIRGIT